MKIGFFGKRYLKKTIKTYNEIAAHYVQTTSNLRPEEEFAAFVQMLVIGNSVLDAGCAGGRDCLALAKRGFRVIGIDLSEEMIEIARNHAPECEFLRADLRKIPLPTNSMDGIWCCASLLHLKRKDVQRALLEFRRVLKGGAVCCILVKKGTGERFVRDTRSQGKPRFYSYFELDEMRELCRTLDFEILVGKTTRSVSGASHEDWLYFLLRKP